jgi:hypothetical protein
MLFLMAYLPFPPISHVCAWLLIISSVSLPPLQRCPEELAFFGSMVQQGLLPATVAAITMSLSTELT